MPWLFPTRDVLTNADLETGRRALVSEAVLSQAMGVLTGGAFLTAFALALGASNLTIGLIAAVGPLSQVLQLPTVWLIERTGGRKGLVVVSDLGTRLGWIAIAIVPWLVPAGGRTPVFILLLLGCACFVAVRSCAFSSWMRDAVPEEVRGRFSAQTLGAATAIGALVALAGGVTLGVLQRTWSSPTAPYSALFLAGAISGLLGTSFLVRVPEPRMPPPGAIGLLARLAEPLRAAGFRRLIAFTGLWSFAVTLSGAFFTVYFLQRLRLPMMSVVGLGVGSQVVSVLCLGRWGALADRFGDRRALTLAGPLFLLVVLGLPFTARFDPGAVRGALLVGVCLLAGVSTAGVAISTVNLAIRAAPRGRATPFLAVNAMVSGLLSAAAPVLGGVLADALASSELAIPLGGWGGPSGVLALRGLDYVFVLSALIGAYALHRLGGVDDPGREGVPSSALPARPGVGADFVEIASVRRLADFPYDRLREPPPDPSH
jgi:MFS family permease